MIQPFGLAFDLLAYQVHGKIRSTLLSARDIVTPDAGTITNIQRVLQPNDVLVVPLSSVLSALAIRSSGGIQIDMTVARGTDPDVVLPAINSTGLTVITDTVKAVTVTNVSSVAVDLSIVSI